MRPTGGTAPRRSLAAERTSTLNPPPPAGGGVVRQVIIAVIVVIAVFVALISVGAIAGAGVGYFIDWRSERLGERIVLLVFACLLSVGAVGCFIAGEVFMCVPKLKEGVTKLEVRVEVCVALAFVMGSLALSCWILGISFFPLRDNFILGENALYLVPGILVVVSSLVVAIVMVLYVELRVRLCTGWGKVSRSYFPYALHGILFLIYSLLLIAFIPATLILPYQAYISLVNIALPIYVIGCILLCSQSQILMTVAGCIGTTLCFAFGLIPGTGFYRQEGGEVMFQAFPFVVVVSVIGLVLSFGPGFRGICDTFICGRNVNSKEEEEEQEPEQDQEEEQEAEIRSLWRGNSWAEGRLFLANVLSCYVTILSVLYSVIQLIGFLPGVGGGYFGISFVYPDSDVYDATRGSVGFFLCLGIGIFHFVPWLCGQNVLYPFVLLVIGGLLTPSLGTFDGIPVSVVVPCVILLLVFGFLFYGNPRIGVEDLLEEEEENVVVGGKAKVGVQRSGQVVEKERSSEEEEGEWEEEIVEEWVEEEEEEEEEEIVLDGDKSVPKKTVRPERAILAWLSGISRSIKTGCTGSLFSPCEANPSPSPSSAEGERTSFCTESVYTFSIFICTCALVLLRSYVSPSQSSQDPVGPYPWYLSSVLIYGKGMEIASWIALFLLGLALVLRLMKLILPISVPTLFCPSEKGTVCSKPARFYLTLGPLFTVAFCFVLTLVLASIRYLPVVDVEGGFLDDSVSGLKVGSLLLLILMLLGLVSSNLYFLVVYGYLRLRKNEDVSRLKLQTITQSCRCLSLRLSSFWGLELLQMLCQIVIFIVASSFVDSDIPWLIPLFGLFSYLLAWKPRFVLSLDLKTRVGTLIPKSIRPTFLLPFVFALCTDWLDSDVLRYLPAFGLAFVIAAIEIATSRGNWHSLVNVGVSVAGVIIWRLSNFNFADIYKIHVVTIMKVVCTFVILGILAIRNVFSAVSTYWRKKKEAGLCCPGKPRLKVKVTSLSEFDYAFGEDIVTGGLQFLALFLGLATTGNVRKMFDDTSLTVAWQVGITMLAFLAGYKRGLSLRFSESHFDSELLRAPTLVPLAAAIFVTIVRYVNSGGAEDDYMGLVSIFLLIPISKIVLHRRRRIIDSCLFVLMCLLMIGLVVLTSMVDFGGRLRESTIISCVVGGILFVILVVDVGIDVVNWVLAKIRGTQPDGNEEEGGEGEEVAIDPNCGNVFSALDSFASQIFRASLLGVVSILCLPVVSRLAQDGDRTLYFYIWGIIVLVGYLLAFEFQFVFLKGIGCCLPSGLVLPKCFRPANVVMLCVMFFLQFFPIVSGNTDNQAWILVLIIFAIDFEVSPGRHGIINGIVGIMTVTCSILIDFFRGYGDGTWVDKERDQDKYLPSSIWSVRSLSFAAFAVLILENNIRKIWVPYIRSGELKRGLTKIFSSKVAVPSEPSAVADIEMDDGKIVEPDAVVLDEEPSNTVLTFGDLNSALGDFWKLEFCGAGFEQLFCLVCMMFLGWHFMKFAWMGDYERQLPGKHAWDGYVGALIAMFMWLSTFKPEYLLFSWRKGDDDVRKFLLPRMLRPTLLMVFAVCGVGLAFKSQFWILAFLVVAVEITLGRRKFLIANLLVGAVIITVYLIVDGVYLIALFRKPLCALKSEDRGVEMCVEGILPLRWVLIVVLCIGLLIHNIIMHIRHWKALLKQKEVISIPCKCPKCSDWTFLLWEIKESVLIVVILCLAYPLLLESGVTKGNWPFSIVYVAVLVAIWIFSFKPLGFAFSAGSTETEEGVTFVLPRLFRPTFLLSGAGYLLLVISSPDEGQDFPRMVLWAVFGFALLIEAAVGLFTSRSSRVILGICLLVAGIPFVLGDILNLVFREDQYFAWDFGETDRILLLIFRILLGAAALFLLVIDNIVAHVTFMREKASSWLTVVGWFRACCPRKPDVDDEEENEGDGENAEDVGFLDGIKMCREGGVKTIWPLTVEFFHGVLHLAATYLLYPLVQHPELYGPPLFASLMLVLWLSSFKLEFVFALSEEGARYCFPKLLRPTVLIPLVGVFVLIVCVSTPYYLFGLIPILVELITARRANGVANVLIAAFYVAVLCLVGEFRSGNNRGDFDSWEESQDWTFFFMRMASAGVLMFVLAVTAVLNIIRWIRYIREVSKQNALNENEENEWVPWRSIRSVDFGNLGNDLFIALLQVVVIYLTYPTLGYGGDNGIFLGVLLVLSVLGFHPGFMPILELSPTRKIAFSFVGLLRPSLIVPLIGFVILMFSRSYLWPFALIFPLVEMEMSLIFRMRVLNLPVFFLLGLLFMVYGPVWIEEDEPYMKIPRIVFIFLVLCVLAFDNVLHHVFFWIVPAVRERVRKSQVTATKTEAGGDGEAEEETENLAKSSCTGLQIAHFTPLATEIYHAMLLVVLVLFVRTNFLNWDDYSTHWLTSSSAIVCLCFGGWLLSLKREFLILDRPNGQSRITFTLPRMLRPSLHVIPIALVAYLPEDASLTFYDQWCIVLMFYAFDSLLGKIKHRWANSMIFGVVAVAAVIATACYGGNVSLSPVLRVATVCVLLLIILVDNLFHWIRSAVLRRKMELQVVPVPIQHKDLSTAFRISNCSERLFGFFYDLHHAFLLIAAFGIGLGSYIWNGVVPSGADPSYVGHYALMVVVAAIGWLVSFKPFHAVSMSKKVCAETGVVGRFHTLPKLLRPSLFVTILFFNAIGILFGSLPALRGGAEFAFSYILVAILVVEIWIEMNAFSMVSLLFAFLGLTPTLLYWWIMDRSYLYSGVAERYHLERGIVPWWRPVTRDIILLVFLLVGFCRAVFGFFPQKKEESNEDDLGEKVPELKEKSEGPATGISRFVQIRNPVATYASSMIFFVIMMLSILLSGPFHIATIFCFLPMPILIVFFFPSNAVYKKILMLVSFVVYMVKILPSLVGMVPQHLADLDYQVVYIVLMAVGAVYWAIFVLVPCVRTRLELPWMNHLFFDICQMKANGECTCQDVTNVVLNIIYYLVRAGAVAGVAFGPTVLYFSEEPLGEDGNPLVEEKTVDMIWLFYVCSLFSFFYLVACVVFLAGDFLSSVLLPVYVFYQYWFPSYFYSGDIIDPFALERPEMGYATYFIPFLVSGIFSFLMFLIGKLTDIFGVSSLFPLEVRQEESKPIYRRIDDFVWEFHYFWAIGMTLAFCWETPTAYNIPAYVMFVIILIRTLVTGSFFQVVVATTFSLLQIMYLGRKDNLRHGVTSSPYGELGFIPVVVQVVIVCLLSGVAFDLRRARTKAEAPKNTKIAWKRLAMVGGRGVVTLVVFLFPLLLYGSFGGDINIGDHSLGVIVIYEVLGVVYVFYLGIILGNYFFLLLTPFLTLILIIIVLIKFLSVDEAGKVVVYAGLAGWGHALILYIFSQTGVMYAFNSPVAKSLLVYPFHALWMTIKRLLSCCKGGECLKNLRWFGPGKLYAKITEKKLAAARAAGVDIELEDDSPSEKTSPATGDTDVSLGKEKGSQQTDVVVQIAETETKLVDLDEESSEEEYEEESEWEGESEEGSGEGVTIEVVYVNGSGSEGSGEIEEEIVYVSASEEEGEVVYTDDDGESESMSSSEEGDSEEREVEEEEVLSSDDDDDDDEIDGVRDDVEDPFDFLFTDEESADDDGQDDESDNKVVLSCGRYFQLLCAELGKNMKGSLSLPMSKNLTVFLLFILVALSGLTPSFGVCSLISSIALAAHAFAYRLYVPLIFSPLVACLFCGLSTGMTFFLFDEDNFNIHTFHDGVGGASYFVALCSSGIGLTIVSVVVLVLTGIRDCCVCLGRIDDSEPKQKDELENHPEYRDELMAIMESLEVIVPSCPASSKGYGKCMAFDLLKIVTFASRSGTPKYAWWRFALHVTVSTYLMIGVYLATMFPMGYSTGVVCLVGWSIGIIELILFCVLKTDESQQLRLIVSLVRILLTTLVGAAIAPFENTWVVFLPVFLILGGIFGLLVAGILIYLLIAFLRRHEERSQQRAIAMQEEELRKAKMAKFERCRRSIDSRDFNGAKSILGSLKEELGELGELEEGSELADQFEDLQSDFNIGLARHTLTIACGRLGDLRFIDAAKGYRVAKECPIAPDDLKAECVEFEENFLLAMRKEIEASREFIAGGGFMDAREHLERVSRALRDPGVKILKLPKIRKMVRTARKELDAAETANATELLDAAKELFREKKYLNCLGTLKLLKKTGKFQSEMSACIMAVAKVTQTYAARATEFFEAQEYEKARELYAQVEHLGIGAHFADKVAECDKLRRAAVVKLKSIDRRLASKKLLVNCKALRLLHELKEEYPPFRTEVSKRLLQLKRKSSSLLEVANGLYSREEYSKSLEILEAVVKMDPDSQKFADPLVQLCVTERRAAKGLRSARESLKDGVLKDAVASAREAIECSLKDSVKESGQEILEEVSRVSSMMLSKAQEIQLLLHRTRSSLKISASVDAHPTVPTLSDDGSGVDVVTASVDAHPTVPTLPDDGSGVDVITASVDAHPTVPTLRDDVSDVDVVATAPTLSEDGSVPSAPTFPEDGSTPSAPTFPQDASGEPGGVDAVRTVLFAKSRPEDDGSVPAQDPVPSAPTFPVADAGPSAPSAFLQETWGKGLGDFFALLAERPEMLEQMPAWVRELLASKSEEEERGED